MNLTDPKKWFYLINRFVYAGMVYLEYVAVTTAVNTIPTSCVQYGEIGASIYYYILLMTPFMVGDALYFGLGWIFFYLGKDPAAIVYNFVAVPCLIGIAFGVYDPVTRLCGNYAEMFTSLTAKALYPAGLHFFAAVIFQCMVPDRDAIPGAHKAHRNRMND